MRYPDLVGNACFGNRETGDNEPNLEVACGHKDGT